MQFEFWMKEIIILYRNYFNWHWNLGDTNLPLHTRVRALLAKSSERRTPRNLGSSWPYEVHMFTSSCNLSWTKWNRLCKIKYWNKFTYSCIQFFFLSQMKLQLEDVITCSWNNLEELTILKNLSLIKTKRSVFRLRCNRKTFVWHPPSQLLSWSRLHLSTATRLTIICLHM